VVTHYTSKTIVCLICHMQAAALAFSFRRNVPHQWLHYINLPPRTMGKSWEYQAVWTATSYLGGPCENTIAYWFNFTCCINLKNLTSHKWQATHLKQTMVVLCNTILVDYCPNQFRFCYQFHFYNLINSCFVLLNLVLYS